MGSLYTLIETQNGGIFAGLPYLLTALLAIDTMSLTPTA